MSELATSSEALREVAEVLELCFDEIIAAYERRLRETENPLVFRASTCEQLRAHARSVLVDVARILRGQEELSKGERYADPLSEFIGATRARENVHASESLRAAAALSEAALSTVVKELPTHQSSSTEVAALALAIQKSIMERVARASVSYGSYLLHKLHESHADERRRISRELHDRVAHSIVVVFRDLELCEMYEAQEEPSKAREKLEQAKHTAQETLKMTRDLSSELRKSSAAEGLEVTISNYLRSIAPADVVARVSVEGDESLVPPEVRDELFLVIREAVRNAMAYSGARKIRVGLCTTSDRFTAAVEDDGQGFEPEATMKAGGTGISSMRERTALLGGMFALNTTQGRGTKIEISVPLPRRRV